METNTEVGSMLPKFVSASVSASPPPAPPVTPSPPPVVARHGRMSIPVTFGINTINFGDLSPDGSEKPVATTPPVAGEVDKKIGMPIKLNQDSPSGTLPDGLEAGPVYWVTGSGPNYSLAKSKGGLATSFSGGSGLNTAILVDAPKRSTPSGDNAEEAIVLLNDARERLAVNAISDVGYFIGRAIAVLGG